MTRARALVASTAIACGSCGGPAATSPPTVTIPDVPAAARASAPAQPPQAPPAAPAPEVKDIAPPTGACIVEADAPSSGASQSTLGLSHVYVEGSSVASVGALGTIRHVRLALADGTPAWAALAVDAEIMSVRGSAPLRGRTSDDLDLRPRTRVVRDGWLEYREIRVMSVNDAKLEPRTELPAWLTPAAGFSDAAFLVPCTDLTPFVAPRREEVPDGALTGAHVSFEDATGRTVATIDAPRDGVPVVMLGAAKGRTRVRFEAGRYTIGEGWVASRHVKTSTWGGVGYGSGHGRLRPLPKITCEAETPLHVRVGGVTYAWGTLHAMQSLEGERTADGSFALRTGGAAEAAPFVPSDRVPACRIAETPAHGRR